MIKDITRFTLDNIRMIILYLTINRFDRSQLWFLWMLFDVFCIVWIISNWLKNDFIAIFISCISWLIGYVCGARFSNIFCVWTAFNYLPFFILGMKLREKNNCLLYKIPAILFVFIQLVLFGAYQMTSSMVVNHVWLALY